MDDSMRSAVLEELCAELQRLWAAVTSAEDGSLERLEGTVRDGVLAILGAAASVVSLFLVSVTFAAAWWASVQLWQRIF